MQDISFVMWTAQWSRTDSPTMSVILSIWIIAPVQITELWDDMVQLKPTSMSYSIYRAESRERFEKLLQKDNRNNFYTAASTPKAKPTTSC